MNDYDCYDLDFTYEEIEDMDTSYQRATTDALQHQREAEGE